MHVMIIDLPISLVDIKESRKKDYFTDNCTNKHIRVRNLFERTTVCTVKGNMVERKAFIRLNAAEFANFVIFKGSLIINLNRMVPVAGSELKI